MFPYKPKIIDAIEAPSGLMIYHTGPALQNKALPALFYFALSGEESLSLDPFNQPVAFLKDEPIHIFSFTIPFHGMGIENSQTIVRWAEAAAKEQNFIGEFIEKCRANIKYLIEQGFVDPQRLAAAGLSRGGFIATHLAAEEPSIQSILGYAPLTELTIMEEFANLKHQPLVNQLSLSSLVEKLVGKNVRFYIGNRDLRVSTDECYEFIRELTEANFLKGVRSPPVELYIKPSIGHKGHGTLPYVFEDGINWIKERLKYSID